MKKVKLFVMTVFILVYSCSKNSQEDNSADGVPAEDKHALTVDAAVLWAGMEQRIGVALKGVAA